MTYAHSFPRGKTSSVLSAFARTAILALLLLLSGCTRLLVEPMLEPLERSLAGQHDLDLLYDGTPALLLIMDGLVETAPTDTKILTSAIRAHAGFAMLLLEQQNHARASRHAERARNLAIKLIANDGRLPDFGTMDPALLASRLTAFSKEDVPFLYWTAFGLTLQLRTQPDSPRALALLPRIVLLMDRVLTLDETYEYGGAHLFFGYYYGIRPPMLGGDPEKSRSHFEQALELTDRKYLPTLVLYAESYARQIFDPDLYTALLTEVLAHQDFDDRKLAAVNALAHRQATRLLAEKDTFF